MGRYENRGQTEAWMGSSRKGLRENGWEGDVKSKREKERSDRKGRNIKEEMGKKQ